MSDGTSKLFKAKVVCLGRQEVLGSMFTRVLVARDTLTIRSIERPNLGKTEMLSFKKK